MASCRNVSPYRTLSGASTSAGIFVLGTSSRRCSPTRFLVMRCSVMAWSPPSGAGDDPAQPLHDHDPEDHADDVGAAALAGPAGHQAGDLDRVPEQGYDDEHVDHSSGLDG